MIEPGKTGTGKSAEQKVRQKEAAAPFADSDGEDIDIVVPPPASSPEAGNAASKDSSSQSSSLLALVTLFVLVFAFYTMRKMRPNYYSPHLYDTAVTATTSENTKNSADTSRAGTTTLPASGTTQQPPMDEEVTPLSLYSAVNPPYSFLKEDAKVLGRLPLPPQSPEGLNPSQLRDLYQLFYDLDAVLVEKGVNYFALGGSLLGAVRNKGVIPWDTDGDVGISLADYKKFIQLKHELRVRGYGLSEQWWTKPVSGRGPQLLKVFRLEEVDSPDTVSAGVAKSLDAVPRPFVDVFLYDFAHPVSCEGLYGDKMRPYEDPSHVTTLPKMCAKSLAMDVGTDPGPFAGAAVNADALKNLRRYPMGSQV